VYLLVLLVCSFFARIPRVVGLLVCLFFLQVGRMDCFSQSPYFSSQLQEVVGDESYFGVTPIEYFNLFQLRLRIVE
jgi:hypothetical protein